MFVIWSKRSFVYYFCGKTVRFRKKQKKSYVALKMGAINLMRNGYVERTGTLMAFWKFQLGKLTDSLWKC